MPLPRPANQNTPEKITNALQLQSLSDREIHARFGLSSNLAVQVCRSIPPYTGGVEGGWSRVVYPFSQESAGIRQQAVLWLLEMAFSSEKQSLVNVCAGDEEAPCVCKFSVAFCLARLDSAFEL
ncbi:hypothetical protein ACVW0Q_002673 [Thermostichus sp. MS-CIW-21]|jgi:hypothetical protein|nr:hypothetical protein SYN65AY6A5_13615 [Synechococcus sp. 65AY6A5]PIK96472.1 hypothetical protein SYN60AY4M2_08740 [Synechococcus sp. 60AY4M2]PIK99070.1 hypothetical protein SYN63AY4M1_06130 [Synechococcus sp. 63AY4M1]PIL02485.1 hypothetical protein SYN65AY640_07920 [Synechococcus sp. 65AY640]